MQRVVVEINGAMKAFLKVSAEAFLKVSVLGHLLSACFASGGAKWRREDKYLMLRVIDEWRESSFSLSLKLVGDR